MMIPVYDQYSGLKTKGPVDLQYVGTAQQFFIEIIIVPLQKETITKTCLCNILQIFMAVKMAIFS